MFFNQTISLAAAGSQATPIYGDPQALVEIHGTYGTAVVIIEGSDDNGTTWGSLAAVNLATLTPPVTGNQAPADNSVNQWLVNTVGMTNIRLRLVSIVSGTVAGRLVSVPLTGSPPLPTPVVGTVAQYYPQNAFAITHAPAVNTQATISKAAAAGLKNVCTGFSCTLANDGTGSAQAGLLFNLRDGATGAGTILASVTLSVPATAGACQAFSISGLNIPGTTNVAMTLETAAATAAHTAASVALFGYQAP